VRAGLFEDVDTVLHWHPSDQNPANAETSLANKSARFKFRGISSHAAAAPERGRSALDGVEAMNFMVNMMREHVPQETRIHYVITRGGEAPNVVPGFAEVYYHVRHSQAEKLQQLWKRVVDVSRAAALGTGTDVEVEVMHGNHSLLPNEELSRQMHANLTSIGGIR
jgi:aminobenzoyl-glutamate utilization protein B